MPPTKRWLLGKYVPVMQDCWAYCFSSKAKDRLLVSRLVTNTTAKSRLRVDIIDWLDFTFARSTRLESTLSIDSTRLKIDGSTRSISRSTAYPACPGNMRIKTCCECLFGRLQKWMKKLNWTFSVWHVAWRCHHAWHWDTWTNASIRLLLSSIMSSDIF